MNIGDFFVDVLKITYLQFFSVLHQGITIEPFIPVFQQIPYLKFLSCFLGHEVVNFEASEVWLQVFVSDLKSTYLQFFSVLVQTFSHLRFSSRSCNKSPIWNFFLGFMHIVLVIGATFGYTFTVSEKPKTQHKMETLEKLWPFHLRLGCGFPNAFGLPTGTDTFLPPPSENWPKDKFIFPKRG